jgi:hypothetical protein
MLRFSPSLTGATTRLAVLLASAALLTGCGADAENPVGPNARFDAGIPVSVAETDLAAREPTNIQFGDFALHIPANVHRVRGILLTLGGPDTRGFAAAGTPFRAPLPAVEASLHVLGEMLRDLAADRGLAILGTSRFGPFAYPNDPASDQLLLDAVAEAVALSGRLELLDAPFLIYGISGGAPEASGFTSRNPGRVAALFLTGPAGVEVLTGEALGVPTYMILSELDEFVDNIALAAAFEANRSAGAPWALALEPGVSHFSLLPARRELIVNWMRAILPFRAAGGSLRERPTHVGWLGDMATGNVAPAATYAGDLGTVSWFPTRPLAEEWAAFIGF